MIGKEAIPPAEMIAQQQHRFVLCLEFADYCYFTEKYPEQAFVHQPDEANPKGDMPGPDHAFFIFHSRHQGVRGEA